MRVLIIHSRYLSGLASGENSVVEDEARLLSEGGHEVQVWQPTPSHVAGVGLVRTGIETAWSAQAVAQVRAMVREAGAHVVHAHNLFPTLSPAVLSAAADEGATVIMTLHNYRLMCLPATYLRSGRICEDCAGRLPWRGVLHRCYRGSLPGSAALAASLSVHRALRTFDRVDLYLAVSEFLRAKYVDAGFRPERVRIKSNFAWATTRRQGSGDFFLYVGRLSAEKGIHTVVRAWHDVPARLIVVGDGPDAEELRSIAPEHVEFTGLLRRAEVADLLTKAKALLVPSLSYEAQPRAILEAYAAGVPVIASRIGGLPDLVTDGESGRLVSPRRPGAWAEAVVQLLNESETERLAEGAYQLWKSRYSPERALENLNEVYQSASRK